MREEKIKLAKLIHKFETDYLYRDYFSKEHADQNIRKLAYKIACDSINWIYFLKSDKEKYPELLEKIFKVSSDGYLCVEMVAFSNNDIGEKLAELIIQSVTDTKLLGPYTNLFVMLKAKGEIP